MSEGNADFKNVGTAKIASSGKSLLLELHLTADLTKPCYIGLNALQNVINGHYRDATVYQLKKAE